MAVDEILDEIENLVVDGKHIMFTNKCLIEEQDLMRLIDDLRNELPMELQKANKIMEDRDSIISVARDEATSIVEQAKQIANKMVDESEIVIQSQEKANLIMEQAKAQEQDIMEKTIQNSRQMKENADQYANQVFDHMITNVSNALGILQQAKTELNRYQNQSAEVLEE